MCVDMDTNRAFIAREGAGAKVEDHQQTIGKCYERSKCPA